ncbi:MAG TPA: Gfo/Idh/MocA family oxidoreductase [bacterium]|nr:Gfo/Idh/MocA family oxidoreductase [bacterium]
MSQPVRIALLGAGSRGELNLATLARRYPDRIRFVAVAEPHQGRRERFVRDYGLDPALAFNDWRELTGRPRVADAVINTLPCRLHYDSARAAIEAGYHMLLEKPMSLEPWQCVDLVSRAKAKATLLGVSVQNRFNPIYQRAKKLLDNGAVGMLVNVDCAENIGYWHFVLSYVRGIHHHSSMSHSFMMAKGIHDIDLICWLVGARVKRVAGFGSLKFFTPDNAPPGAPERCMDGCPVESSCVFSAIKQYLKPGRPDIPARLYTGQSLEAVVDLIRYPRFRTMASIITQHDLSEDGIKKSLAETDYGRCVFHAPNNVVDHQSVSLEFDNGVTASYSLSGFSLVWERTLNFHGSKGELRTADFSGRLETRTYHPAAVRKQRIPYHGILHGGGDKTVLLAFADAVSHQSDQLLIAADTCLDAHLVGFASEKARTQNVVVDMEEFRKEAEEKAAAQV